MRLVLIALSLGLAGPVYARPKAPPPAPPRRPAAPAPSVSPAAPPQAPAEQARPAPLADETSAALLARTQALYDALEYDRVIPLAEALVVREDLTLEQKLKGYELLGSAKAIVLDPLEAERPFRMLLRANPKADLQPNTPPKILAVFRKVQTEERALAEQLAQVERDRIVAGLRLLDEPPASAQGGKPLPFSLRLRDPSGAVESVRVPYRRAGQPGYSSLALQRSLEGSWQGAIPGEFTSDEQGFQLEYYVETLDANRAPLLTVGSEQRPRVIPVEPGVFSTARPPPLPKWAFFTGLGLTVASGAAATGVGVAFQSTQADYTRRASAGGTVDGAELAQLRQRGTALGDATTGLLISTGVTALVTALLTPFTDWKGEAAK